MAPRQAPKNDADEYVGAARKALQQVQKYSEATALVIEKVQTFEAARRKEIEQKIRTKVTESLKNRKMGQKEKEEQTNAIIKELIEEFQGKNQTIIEKFARVVATAGGGQNDVKPTLEEQEFLAKMMEYKIGQLESEIDRILTRASVIEFHGKYLGKDLDRYRIDVDNDDKGVLDFVVEAESNNSVPKKETRFSAQPQLYLSNQKIFVVALSVLFVGLFVGAGFCATTNYCGPNNFLLDILQSEIMLGIISVVIAPVVVSVMKERFDIQIEKTQVDMIMNDAVNAVKMYHKEANKLRDENGHIQQGYQTKLRDLAFESIKSNYSVKKYESVVASVGSQVFEKAIEEAVKRDWTERFPREKAQVEAIIKQSIDALPQIIEWRNIDEDVKIAFLDGHVRRLLVSVGLEGWGGTKLVEMFESEANRRLAAAAIVESAGLLKALAAPGANKYLRYTTPAMIAAEATVDSRIKSLPSQ